MLPDFRDLPYTTEEYLKVMLVHKQERDRLRKDPRVEQTSVGLQTVKGGERLVIRVFTKPLEPKERKGFKGRIQGVPLAYTSAIPEQQPYRP